MLTAQQGEAAPKDPALPLYLACPLHTLPDGEVDQQPGQGQRASQGPADGARLPQASRHLMHVPPKGGRLCVRRKSNNQGQRGLELPEEAGG